MQYKIFWCKVNKYYTDKWLNSSYLKDKQGIFVASCVVTDQAKRKWIKFIKDIFKEYKDLNIWFSEWKLSESQSMIGWVFDWAKSNIKSENNKNWKVYISWCWAFKDWRAQEDFFELYPELKEFEEKIKILGEDPEEKKLEWKKQINFAKLSPLLQKKGTKDEVQIYTKKFILIQGWCDSFCSFCLTVQKRWRHYFRAKEDIAEEIADFEKNWWKEVVLTWINLAAWGLDSTNPDISPVNDIRQVKSKLAELLEYILQNTKIKRLRISSLGPEFVDEKLLKIFENKRIYPHFHFSVQSGSNNVLKNMKRHYSWDFMKNILLKLRNIKREDNVDISIWADIIVGFPGETENDFLETLDLIETCKITKVHAFPFSAHKLWENVPAWFYKNQIDDKTKKERMNRILELSDKIRNDFIKENIWKEFEVLIEVVDWNNWKGWTQNYIEANNENTKIISWNIKKNEIIKIILK